MNAGRGKVWLGLPTMPDHVTGGRLGQTCSEWDNTASRRAYGGDLHWTGAREEEDAWMVWKVVAGIEVTRKMG